MNTYRLQDEELERIIAFRHDLHMHPELSGEEYRTTEKVRAFLSGLPGVSIVDLPVKTGVVAQIHGTVPGEVMLRADMDALPRTEETDIPWKSQVPGVMHACGHDLHTACLCGAALLLTRMRQNKEDLPTVDLVFQPAEEGTRGARMLIDAGLFEKIRPDVCFGFHNWPSLDTGTVVCREGALMSAKRNFDIVLTGRGGHGAMPHLCVDPIVCAAAVVQSLQTVISRNINPLEAAILSVNRIEGGSPVNLVVDRVELKATIRSLSEDVLDHAIERIEGIVENTAKAYECQSGIIWKEKIPAVWNSEVMTKIARSCVEQTDCRLTQAPPSLASEDFALYRSHVPSFFFWLGSRVPGTKTNELHTARFFADDSALRYGAELYAACAEIRTWGRFYCPESLFMVN